ncbi:Lyzozyme M1 (1,4-beta-N-acetylmuramidase), GH25 family [Amycolatopsis arida]|uniref:lysozyme n=1 Tax=Amycolatopsis arida TaxID=587909 RepID=A0A1I5SZ89_9PSEU|nr:lysozyme [Amycolatopsis arida]TDX96291.1 GH25 family lysozyme M1 (1,4-beta-N-acetylmuramidase) [Amycolatopsis arida]SFP76038.1 Lyzozyme M1 (1,4-beta-N-acetylmuramidase), GH25 family [Amycolatopsis arida]
MTAVKRLLRSTRTAVAVAASTTLLGAAAGLGAGTAAAEPDPRYAGAEQRHAGSQIARHEGVHGPPRYAMPGQTLGHDVSGWQGDVDWPAAVGAGAKFVYIKATEGTGFVSKRFAQQYDGSFAEGMIRGAYHFGRPDISGGAEQARYFVDHGGGWSADGRTLPGALDMEYNPYGEACYGKDPGAMVGWIRDFSDTYHARTGRHPTIYTSTSWWRKCTGDSAEFGATNPLWLARYAPEIGPLPAGWPTHTIWQFADRGALPGDQNYFNGAHERLAALAQG